MEHRRSWLATIDGVDHRIDVVYAALSGWMTIEVDGQRRQRGWREFQTVFGGAVLSCDLDGHRLEARITQPFQQQLYSFALRIDGEVQPGSDPQPEPGNLIRQTLIAIGWLTLSITVVIVGMRVLGIMG
ncbi:MAG: hypothetical protein QOD78_2112 [Chloroflexota bacterium]|jgi:hypothetical protein|nr:hypothetical protein [Chloroflexota bacterium]MEA2612915.1 hypothetical protein [Chloroflexota bacterium]